MELVNGLLQFLGPSGRHPKRVRGKVDDSTQRDHGSERKKIHLRTRRDNPRAAAS